jgi:DNA-binding CsgD family transcriptional regulator
MRTHRASVCGARPLRVSGGSTIPVRFCAARVEGDRVLLVYHPSPDGVDLILNTSEPVGGEPTARQRQVITLLALGLTDDQMAQRLMLSPDTVRTHLRNAMRITRAYNRPHLVAKALQRGWIAQPA